MKLKCSECKIFTEENLSYKKHRFKDGSEHIAVICPKCDRYLGKAPRRQPYVSRVKGEYFGKDKNNNGGKKIVQATVTEIEQSKINVAQIPVQKKSTQNTSKRTSEVNFEQTQLILQLRTQLKSMQQTLDIKRTSEVNFEQTQLILQLLAQLNSMQQTLEELVNLQEAKNRL